MKIIPLFTIVLFLGNLQKIHAQNAEISDSTHVALSKLPTQERLEHLLSLGLFKTGEYQRIEESFTYASMAKDLADSLSDENSFAKALMIQGVAMASLNKRDEGIDSIRRAIELAISLDDKPLLAEAYLSLGLELSEKDEHKLSIQNQQKSLELFTYLDDSLSMSYAYNNIGRSYFHLGDMVAALRNYHEALLLKQIVGDQNEVAGALDNLALVYKRIDNYDKALLYNRRSIEIQKARQDTFSLSLSYLNVGNIYRKLHKYDSAIIYHSQALSMSESLYDTIGIAYACYNLGSAYFDKKSLSKSRTSFLKALEIFKKSNSKSLQISTMSALARVYLELKDLTSARNIAAEALSIAESLERSSHYQGLLEILYEVNKAKGNYQKALEYHEQFFIYSDSLLNQQKVESITELETNFEIVQRDNEIELLNKTNEINDLRLAQSERNKLIYFLFGVLLLGIIGILYRSYKGKKRAEEKLADQNRRLEELNAAKDKFFAIIAHDLNSPLSAFKSLSTGLSENFRQLSEMELQNYLVSLKTSSEELVSLLQNLLQWALSQTKNLRLNRQNINLGDLLTKNVHLLEENASQKSIDVEVQVEKDYQVYADAQTVDLVFRNLIANAIKFTSINGKIAIKTSSDQDMISIEIEDTGIGMTSEDINKLFKITEDVSHIGSSKEKGTGLGLILCKEFIERNNGQILVESELGVGSTFKVILPAPGINTAA